MYTLVLLFVVVGLVKSIPIDNGLPFAPEVSCGSRSVIMTFSTENSYTGRTYVKNHFTDDACRFQGDGTQRGFIELDFNTCGVKRERSLEPRGIFVSVTVVISFHKTFLTKVDRAMRIECFYMEADKTVSQELEVSMISTALQTLNVPMPVCRYDILDGGPNGDPVRFALIGRQVYHKWTCDTDTTDTFCMVVYDCYVDDGSGDTIQLLDDEGCSIDEYLLGNLEYPTDLMAGREAHVFKYADRANLFFNCQIRINVKEPGTDCARPQCTENRKKRSYENQGAILDVSTDSLLIGDIDLNEEDIPFEILYPKTLIHARGKDYSAQSGLYCLSAFGFGLLLSIGAMFLIGAVILATFLVMKKY